MNQLHAEGKVPRSLALSLPSIRIQTVGQTVEADDATKAMATTVSNLLFTQLRTSTTSQLVQLRDKFLDSYPRPTQHCFLNWVRLILRARDSPLTPEFQDDISLAHAGTAFDVQLRRGFSVLLWDLREALFTAALQMQRRSMAVRKWFKRNEPQDEELDNAPEPESSLAVENRELKKRMSTLERQLSQLRTSVSTLRQQSDAGASSSRQNRAKKQKNAQQQGGSSSQPPKGNKPKQSKKGKKGKPKGKKKN